ncbi:hypothetical protein SAY86_016305 [Trapa natans]|nr:hypothetical protein SAY86_016305 [Trapa natans]
MATQLELGMAPPNMNPNHLLRHEIIALPQLGYSGGIAIHPNNDDSPYAYLESRQDALQAAGVIPNYGSVHPFFESDDNGTQSYIATSSEDMKDKTQSKERLLLRTR